MEILGSCAPLPSNHPTRKDQKAETLAALHCRKMTDYIEVASRGALLWLTLQQVALPTSWTMTFSMPRDCGGYATSKFG